MCSGKTLLASKGGSSQRDATGLVVQKRPGMLWAIDESVVRQAIPMLSFCQYFFDAAVGLLKTDSESVSLSSFSTLKPSILNVREGQNMSEVNW